MVGPCKEDRSPSESLAYVRQCMPWPRFIVALQFSSTEVEYIYEDITRKNVKRRRRRSSDEFLSSLHVPISGTSTATDVPGKLSWGPRLDYGLAGSSYGRLRLGQPSEIHRLQRSCCHHRVEEESGQIYGGGEK